MMPFIQTLHGHAVPAPDEAPGVSDHSQDETEDGVEILMLKGLSGVKGEGAGKGDALAARCASIPEKMRALGTAFARRELEEILNAKQHKGVLPGIAKRGNVLANLWFIRAVHEFTSAVQLPGDAPGTSDDLVFAGTLPPICKAIVQEFITDKGMNGVRMDDGGMLAGLADATSPAIHSLLRLNALWYSALETTGQAYRGLSALGKAAGLAPAKDQTGNHFERLAGRFRRAFAKAYWCDEHNRICNPNARELPDHGEPDPEQLLLTFLPASPLPRTKQREILAQFEARAGDALGVRLTHREYGAVESPLYRAWMAQGNAAGGGESEIRQAVAQTRPLAALWEAAKTGGVFAYYREGKPIGRQPDLFVSAEVWGTLHRFLSN